MIIDAQLLLSDSQALTGTSAVASTNIIDLGIKRGIGLGEPMAVCTVVKVAAGGTSGTLTTTVQASTDAAFTSPITIAVGPTFTQAQMVAGLKMIIPLGQNNLSERFLRVSYTQGGTSPTVTVSTFLEPISMLSNTDNVFYNDAVTIG